MTTYIVRRLAWAVLVTVGVMTLVFFLIRLVGGDPAQIRLGELVVRNPEVVEEFRRQHNLDRPLVEQYWIFMKGAVRGDFGDSIVDDRPAWDFIKRGLRITVPLAILSLFFSSVIGMGLGMIGAFRHRTWLDTVSSVTALIGVAMPSFYLALLLLLCGGLWLGWFPILGGLGFDPIGDPLGAIHRLFLPAMAVGLTSAAATGRLVRSSTLEELRQPYVLVARARGLPSSVVKTRHALRNALIPTVTVMGLQAGDMISGLIFAEVIFTLPGIGNIFLEAVQTRDYVVIQAAVFFFAISFSLVNLVTDLLYPLLNPKVRLG